ncbi:MAG TPA: hypothetical protein VFZ89_05835 [Solirubrobacteraceae bacterium]
MTLPPDLALAYLATLSVDVRSAAITTTDGRLLAGDPQAVGRGRRVADDEHAIHVTAGPHALVALLDGDLRSILADLRTR